MLTCRVGKKMPPRAKAVTFSSSKAIFTIHEMHAAVILFAQVTPAPANAYCNSTSFFTVLQTH